MVIIDAGHGGTDFGGGSNDLYKEKDLALKISLYQYKRLKELGVPVKLTRNIDINLYPRERINLINSLGDYDILISNHINASQSNFTGSELIYSIGRNREFTDIIAKSLEESGRKINRIYTRLNSRGNDYYYIIRETRPKETVIVEYGFADNPIDAKDILDNYEKYAEAVVKAICIYLGVPYNINNYYNYTVKKDDSLYKISKKTFISVDEIKKNNNLKSDKILPNQVLKIPLREINEIIYYPINGENMRKIASTYNVELDSLIKQEDKVIIPLNKPLKPYILKPGDSLFNIAMKHEMTLYALAKLNNITINDLKSGDVIMVPST